MGNGNVDVGNETGIRKPGRPIVERPRGSDGGSGLRIEAPNTVRVRRPGAMSQQQCGDSGTCSTPQKFVQLVGCREPKAHSWARPAPAKR